MLGPFSTRMFETCRFVLDMRCIGFSGTYSLESKQENIGCNGVDMGIGRRKGIYSS